MPRLPTPGGDSGNWGEILNEYLGVSLSPNGQLKSDSITQDHLQTDSVGRDQLAADSVTTYNLADASVTDDKLADGSVTSTKLASGAITKASIGLDNVDNTSDANKPISTATQTALDSKIAAPSTAVTHNALVRFDGTSGKLVKSSALYTNDSGWIGVGTSSPDRQLHVRGGNSIFRLDRNASAAAMHLHRFPDGDTSWAVPWKGFAISVDAGGPNNGVFAIADYGTNVGGPATQRLRISNEGNIMLGEGSPTHSLTLPSTSSGIALYNTADQTTNYERLRMYWSGNTSYILNENAGSGSQRPLRIGGPSSTYYQIDTLYPVKHTLAATSSAASASIVDITSTGLNSSSGSQFGLRILPSMQQSGTGGYTALLVNPTDSSTGSGPKLLADFQVGSTSKAYIDNSGSAQFANFEVKQISTGSTLRSGITFSGQALTGANSGTGFLFTLGYNIPGNKQIWFGDPDNMGNANGTFIRMNSNGTIDAVSGDNLQRKQVTIGVPDDNGSGVKLAGPISAVYTNSSTSNNRALFSINPTLNQSGTAGYTALHLNVLETTTGSGPKLLADFMVNGVSKVKIANSGQLTIADGTQAAGRVLTSDANGNATWLPSNAEPAGQAVNVNSPGASFDITTAMYPSLRTITLSANLTFTLSATPPASSGGTITLVIKQPASGGPFTITWPTSLEWAGDAPGPTMPTPANAELIVHLLWTGNVWRGTNAGSFFP